MAEEMIEALAKYIAAKIIKQPDRRIGADEPLISSGLVDSFSLVDLALFVEDTFGARIEDSELNASSFDSLRQLAEMIRARQSQ